MSKRKLGAHIRTADPVTSIPAARRGRSAADAPTECPKAQLLAGMQQLVNARSPVSDDCGVRLGVGSTITQAWFPEVGTSAGITWKQVDGHGVSNLLRAIGVVLQAEIAACCEALLAASAESVWEDELPADAAAELHLARETAMRLDDLVARRNALAHAVLAAARALAAKCIALGVPGPLATVSLSLRALGGRHRQGNASGSEKASAMSAVAKAAQLKQQKVRLGAGNFWVVPSVRSHVGQVEREALWSEADASDGFLPPRSGGGCRAKMAAASATAPPPPLPTTLESGMPVDIGRLVQCKQQLKFPRPVHEGGTDDAWHASGMLRVRVLVDAPPAVLASEGRAVAELVHQHMGQFLWERMVSLNGHVQVLQPAKSDAKSMWSKGEEHFCNELSTIAPNIPALLRRCAEDSHIWVRAMSYGPDQPGSFHMDEPLAGMPLVRLPICLGGARAFEVCPKQWTDEALRDLSLDDAMITPLERAGGGGAVVLLPHAYIRTRGATLFHRAGAGEGPGLTLVLEIRCDGSGYGGLAARLEKIGITLFMAD